MANILESFSLKGKNALIICPENPYGWEIAEGLANAGAKVWVAGPAEEVSKEAKFVAGRFVYDHGDPSSAAQLEEAVRSKMGTLDILVENGLYTKTVGWKQSFEEIYDQLQKTHLGMMLTIQSLGHIFAEQGHGSVILVADYGALVGYDPVNYKACSETSHDLSKDVSLDFTRDFSRDFSLVKGFISGGAVNYARQASNYLAEHGCRCNSIAFGPLKGSHTEAFEEAFIRHSQVKRLITPADIGAAAVFLASDASAFITGVTLPVDGGYTAK